jgi:hypothetical protein
MEIKRTDNNKINLVSRLSFFLIILSITSCLIRPDFNLICGFLIIIIFNRYLFKDEPLFLKIIIHILIATSILEIIWFIFSLPSFFFLNKSNIFWKSLSLMHSTGLVLAIIQLLLKIIMCFILYNQYNIVSDSDFTYLKSFNYNSKEIN